MPRVAIRIPQLGEGLHEVLLVRTLKAPGEFVKRNEPLYEIETDKAVTQVESPYAGRLIDWIVESGVVPVGVEIARMEVEDAAEPTATAPIHDAPIPAAAAARSDENPSEVAAAPSLRNRELPPRTREYLRRHGLLELADKIPRRSHKLVPADIDAFLAQQSEAPYVETRLPEWQVALNYRMQQSTGMVVPAAASVLVEWTAIDHVSAKTTQAAQVDPPSPFTMMLWCVVQALRHHASFRSTLTEGGTVLRTFENVHLGIAVASPGDRLATAVLPRADSSSWEQFAGTLRSQIELARQGQDQSRDVATLIVSNIGSLGLCSGIPIVVPPAVATLALGQVDWQPRRTPEGCEFRRMATLTVAFDHRVVNGAGCAGFLNDIKDRIEHFALPAEGCMESP